MTTVPLSGEHQLDERVTSSNRLELAMIIAGILFMVIATIAAVLL